MMYVSIIYLQKEGGVFDFDYYLSKHIPITKEIFGNQVEVLKGIACADGSDARCVCSVRIQINSVEEFVSTMVEKGSPLVEDVPNYTNIEPIVQYDEVCIRGEFT